MEGPAMEDPAMEGAARVNSPAPRGSIGLVTLNARYVHLALSLRYLRNAARAAGFGGTWLAEYTIHTPLWKIAADVLARDPGLLGFSIYIWNRRQTLELIELLKGQHPELRIVVGGPEVSFEAGPPSPFVDWVIAGEGENKWVECLRLWTRGRAPDLVTLARWNEYGSDLPALDALPYSEAEDFRALSERLVYLETSRGCPFACAFCLSALDRQVRFFPQEAVQALIVRLVESGARRIKFLDRTFNLGNGRVRALFAWLFRFEGVRFHFEVVGDLLDREMLRLLDDAPAGMFQFEIGVQSALPETMERIGRRQDAERLFRAVRHLRAAGRVHLHLDLIFGLPGESLAEIRESFERVIALRPHELQLGFLKFLPGAPIRRLVEPYGYRFQAQPPYELIANRHLTAADVLFLKRFEEVFGLYYNSGRFRFTLERLMESMAPWALFRGLAEHFAAHGLLLPAHSQERLSSELLNFARGRLPEGELIDLLKLDYFYHHRARRAPAFLNGREAVETAAVDSTAVRAAVRARRKGDANSAVVAFRHRIRLADGQAALEPSEAPVWYVFSYPQRESGYFFRPEVRALLG